MDLQSLALCAARSGAAAVSEFLDRRALAIGYANGSHTSPVTNADLASEAAIRTLIFEHRPEDGVLAEESGVCPGTSDIQWIIDPLDGTVNFTHGLGHYAISVAATSLSRQETVAAAVIQPTRARCLALGPGGVDGNQDHIGVARTTAARALVAFAVPNDQSRRRDAYLVLAGVAPFVQDLRNFGSTVCDLAAVATGEIGGFITFNPAPWDIAAGIPLVHAAGGTSRQLSRDGSPIIVAGGPTIVAELSERILAGGRITAVDGGKSNP